MIINALTDYYEQLLRDKKVGREGWSFAKISYAITIDKSGHVRGIIPLQSDKNTFEQRIVPLQKGRSRQIAPYFMCDNAKYLLGVWIPSGDDEIDEKSRKQAQDYFGASAEYHKKVLADSDNKLAKSVELFFEEWDFDENKDKLTVDWEKISAASNLIFRSYETGEELLGDAEIQRKWDENRNEGKEEKCARCSITGEKAPIARLHPLIKGVRGAQSSGAALVSFNGTAFESYGKVQGDNAPVSENVANAYGKALNYLLEDKAHHRMLGDTTTVFWVTTEKHENGFLSFVEDFLGNSQESNEKILLKTMEEISKGKNCTYKEEEINPDTPFYILGLSPNAARISVRFFYNNTFGNMVSNIRKHYERMSIESPAYEENEYPSISDILYETVNKKATKKQAQPILVGSLMRAILENKRYPAALYSHILLRIHSERKINRNRAAILKAYIIKNHPDKKEVVNTMKLNEDTDYMPYVLGRLFAVLEDIQRSAIGKETLRDRYFNAASSTPAVVFPQLIKLSNSHLRVLEREKKGLQVNKEKEMGQLMGKIKESFPTSLSLEDQGIFMVGYYHQIQKFYAKKSNDKELPV